MTSGKYYTAVSDLIDGIESDLIAGLDPGIREVVTYLRQCGYLTTDSGDGVSKLGTEQAECMRTEPHVVIRTDPDSLVVTCRYVAEHLARQGVRVVPLGPDGVDKGCAVVEGIYMVGAEVALVEVTHLNDDGLRFAREHAHDSQPVGQLAIAEGLEQAARKAVQDVYRRFNEKAQKLLDSGMDEKSLRCVKAEHFPHSIALMAHDKYGIWLIDVFTMGQAEGDPEARKFFQSSWRKHSYEVGSWKKSE